MAFIIILECFCCCPHLTIKTPRSREVKFPILKTGRLKSDVLRFSLSHAWVFNYPNWHLLLKAELKVKLHLFLKHWAMLSPLKRMSWKMVLSSVPLLPDLCILKNEAPIQSGCLEYSWGDRGWRYWQHALREDENLLIAGFPKASLLCPSSSGPDGALWPDGLSLLLSEQWVWVKGTFTSTYEPAGPGKTHILKCLQPVCKVCLFIENCLVRGVFSQAVLCLCHRHSA